MDDDQDQEQEQDPSADDWLEPPGRPVPPAVSPLTAYQLALGRYEGQLARSWPSPGTWTPRPRP